MATDIIKPMLRVNGVPITLSVDTPVAVVYDEIAGVTDRSARGAFPSTRRNITRSVTCRTAPLSWPDAYAIKSLVEGVGASCGFDATPPFYLNRALAGAASGSGTASFSTAGSGLFPLGYYATTGVVSTTWSSIYVMPWLASSLGCTISFWLRSNASVAQPTVITLSKSGASDPGITLGRSAGGVWTFGYGSVLTLTGAGSTDLNWHMVTAVMRDTSMSNYATASLYFDAAVIASGGSPSYPFAYPQRDTLTIGPSSTSTPQQLDGLTVYPFPLTDTQVAGLYAAQGIYSTSGPTPHEINTSQYLPQVWLSGDGIGDAMLAAGQVTGTQILTASRDVVSDGLLTNGMTMDLRFMEAAAPR